jgi:hypothetical protein
MVSLTVSYLKRMLLEPQQDSSQTARQPDKFPRILISLQPNVVNVTYNWPRPFPFHVATDDIHTFFLSCNFDFDFRLTLITRVDL